MVPRYYSYGIIDSIRVVYDIGIFKFCGMKVIEHKFFSNVPSSDKEKRKKFLDEVREILSKVL